MMSRFALLALLAAPCAAFMAAPQPLRATSARRVAASPTAILEHVDLSAFQMLAEVLDDQGKAAWLTGAAPRAGLECLGLSLTLRWLGVALCAFGPW